MKSKLVYILFAVALVASSCGSSSSNCESSGFAAEFQEEFNNITDATTELSNDPENAAKCEAFKDAYRDYIDALEGWEDCAVTLEQEDEWRQAIDEARASLDDFEC